MNLKPTVARFALSVLPLAMFAASPVDRQIEDGIKATYNYRMLLHGHLTVKANAGIVTLTGDVQDMDEKRLADDTVANIPGVTQVKNDLRIQPTGQHSDAWIAFKIRLRLLLRSHVDSAATTIAVEHGNVTLTGSADSVAQKELTETYAHEADGVKSVHNTIVVTRALTLPLVIGEKSARKQ
jgi:hyperosmotically inducible protein